MHTGMHEALKGHVPYIYLQFLHIVVQYSYINCSLAVIYTS